MRIVDFKISVPLPLERRGVVHVRRVRLRQIVRAFLPTFLLWTEMHVRLIVPETNDLHGIVDVLRGVAKVGDYLAGPRHAVSFYIEYYLVHVLTNNTEFRMSAIDMVMLPESGPSRRCAPPLSRRVHLGLIRRGGRLRFPR